MRAEVAYEPALVGALRAAAVVSGLSIVALVLFYAVELRSVDRHVFGPLNDVGMVAWGVLLIVVVAGLRPALGSGWRASTLVVATIGVSAAGAVASALLVVGALSFELATPVSVAAILVQSGWLHVVSRGLSATSWSRPVVRLGWWAPVAQGVGAVVVGASLPLGWGTTPQLAVMIVGIVVGFPAWAAWPVWFALAAREVARFGVSLDVQPILSTEEENSWLSSPESTTSH